MRVDQPVPSGAGHSAAVVLLFPGDPVQRAARRLAMLTLLARLRVHAGAAGMGGC